MQSDPNKRLAEQITADACAWVAQLETGNLSRADIAALKEWVSRSPAHAAEIQSVARLSGQLSELTENLQHVERARRDHSLVRRMTGRPKLISTFAVMAVFAGVLVFSIGNLSKTRTDVQELITLTGEYETQTLEDGTIIRLNTETRLIVKYSNTSRDVNLLYGEALFEVATDPTRPFTVQAGSSRSEALGTSFSVKLLDDIAELSVLEGVVAFSRNLHDSTPYDTLPAQRKVILNAGQSIAMQTSLTTGQPLNARQIRAVPERELMRQLSWTEGLLEFSDTPLLEVIEEVNRHVRSPLRIDDDRLYDMRIGGIYRAGDQGAMLEAFERLGIYVDQSDPTEIVLKLGAKPEDSQ